MKYAYYPGCLPKGSTPEADVATHWLANALEIELMELDEAGCCGSCEVKAINPQLDLLLNARTLSLAKARELEILTICDTCQANLADAARRISSNPEARQEVIENLERAGIRFEQGARARHLVKILAEDFGTDNLGRHVTRPLRGLRVASFGCCHVFRGPGSDPQNKPLIERMVDVSGGSLQRLRDDSDCCGFHLMMVDEKLATRAGRRFVKKCMEAGADCIVTTSPMCHAALEICQVETDGPTGLTGSIPVLHIEQLLSLSFGADVGEVGMERHMVSTSSLAEKLTRLM